ncbi:MAG: ribokinase [Actinobacteria bacterium]|nr:ribokinase [Actinomycetota bacterium]
MTGVLAVLGAINVDLVVTLDRLPGPGETVGGGSFARHHGGKGGNQAVAAARALQDPGRVVMIGCVGDDELGASAVEALRAEGIGLRVATALAPTGVALIVVDARGENQIAVAPGANDGVLASVIDEALGEELGPGSVVLASLEVPFEGVRRAAEISREQGATFVLNPAPAQPWALELLPHAAFVTPNESELAALGDVPSGVAVIETRGERGARIHAGGSTQDVPSLAVEPVDTTGAGDCFNGVLAAGLLEGLPLHEAVERAVVAAALSVTKHGAREGMPGRAEIDGAVASLRG